MGMGLMATRRKTTVSRTAGGRQSRANKDREFPPTQVRRLRDAAMAGLREPEWGTELGRLYLEGAITAAMYAAGKKWAELAGMYQQSLAIPGIKPPSLEVGRGGASPDPDSIDGKKIVERDRALEDRFNKAKEALERTPVEFPGVAPITVVRRVCEDGRILGDFTELLTLKCGLLQLANHWKWVR